jgi:hypothetical protein
MKCSVCGTESEGRFCAECGAPLADAQCRACKAALVAGARYCTECGEGVYARPDRLPWVIAGIAIAALALVLVMPTLRSESGSDANFGMGLPPDLGGQPAPVLPDPAGGATASPPVLSDDPRTNADRLFNRIMEERGAGNVERAQFFLPMALQAYAAAEPLDNDGLFHLALLQSAAGRFADARTTAERVLATLPDHLLALAAAGEAMAAAGDTAAARGYYRRFLDAYDREKEKVYPEYLDHAAVLPGYQRAARELVPS